MSLIDYGQPVKTDGYVRPVINLKADVRFKGTGTIDDPYVILTD